VIHVNRGNARLVTHRGAPPRTRRRHADRTLTRLRAARDRASALLTVPRQTVRRTWVVPFAARPSVDLADWTHHVAYADRRDPSVLDALVRRYSDFATSTARRQYRRGEPMDDLVQVSHEALMLALQRFDPHRGTPFLAYAAPTIKGTLNRHFRDNGWALRVPRQVHELAKPQQDAFDLLRQDLGRSPTLAEVADLMSVPLSQLEAAQRARHARSTTWVDAGDCEGSGPRHAVGEVDSGLVSVEDRLALRGALSRLDADDVRLLSWYYFQDETQSQIAERLGCSQMQVSRLLARAVQRLRPYLSPNR
jgi:RNA polymerase sigma-B factor